MRSFRHLTPRYVNNRLKHMLYERRYPALPWLTPKANAFLSTYLRPNTDRGLEWGSGRSTLWFSKHLQLLVSVEDNRGWYEKINQRLQAEKCTNVDYRFCEAKDAENPTPEETARYVGVVDTFADNSFDFVLVDGISVIRELCANRVLPKLRPGGLLVVDDANWYLPCNSVARKSRSHEQGPRTPGWKQFADSVNSWRCFWTSNGLGDTAMFFKPLESL